MKILEILKFRTQIKKIFLIPHVNLLSKKTKNKINSREEINLIIDNLTKNFKIFEKIDIWESEELNNYHQEDILDDNYLNFNKLGNKLVSDYFYNKFKKTFENKGFINFKTNTVEELRG